MAESYLQQLPTAVNLNPSTFYATSTKPSAVTNRHAEYNKHSRQWQRIRDALAGSDAVKEAGEAYLPMLGGQSPSDYETYKCRAFWYGATARTADGVTGAVFRKPPTIKVPKALESFLDDITLTDVGFEQFAKLVYREVLNMGRGGILVDMVPEEEFSPDLKRPYFVLYETEQITNWRTMRRDGHTILAQVVLHEYDEEAAADGFGIESVEQYRVLNLEHVPDERIPGKQNWVYTIQLYRKQKNVQGQYEWLPYGGKETPTRRGQALDSIPFYFSSPEGTAPAVKKSPLLDLADANFDHYRLMADYRHGLHFTGLPTAWVAGFPENSEFKIGSQTAWVSSDTNASAGFLEYTGQGLGAPETALEKSEHLMAVLGARLLEQQKRAAEAAETLVIRQAGEESVVVSIAKSVSRALENALWRLAWWSGAVEDLSSGVGNKDVSVLLNTDIVEQQIDATMLTALVSAWHGGAMSKQTLLYNLKQGEIIPDRVSVEEEIALIDSEGPVGGVENPPPLNGGQQNNMPPNQQAA
ncbi:MAG TPA: DUF4055 domain-containing protein [Candidatus Binatia bacterium]|jgi:hypothetical protein|nr:DUF4055 domain-containing protein [Candidatus Binatia bacterium]